MDGFGSYPIRFFESVKSSSKTKKHYSKKLVKYAREFDADIYILKGVDGGVGIRLLERYIIKREKKFAFIIGGKYYNKYVPRADFVFYETEEQKRALENPGWYFWRSDIPDYRLIRMPKSVDTDQFCPMPEIEKEWDIVSVGRLVSRYKNYDALGPLSNKFDVAVVGGGPDEAALQEKYPNVDWVGAVPHPKVPEMMNRAQAFMHPGYRDYFPRVIAEAAACGVPVLAFACAIAPDVLPPGCGLRLHRKQYVSEVEALFRDKELIKSMGKRARTYALNTFGKHSTAAPMKEMINKINKN
jgi:glycosyltransferase involved in cell wall biosynthesis